LCVRARARACACARARACACVLVRAGACVILHARVCVLSREIGLLRRLVGLVDYALIEAIALELSLVRADDRVQPAGKSVSCTFRLLNRTSECCLSLTHSVDALCTALHCTALHCVGPNSRCTEDRRQADSRCGAATGAPCGRCDFTVSTHSTPIRCAWWSAESRTPVALQKRFDRLETVHKRAPAHRVGAPLPLQVPTPA
jgi:hypothetical protein